MAISIDGTIKTGSVTFGNTVNVASVQVSGAGVLVVGVSWRQTSNTPTVTFNSGGVTLTIGGAVAVGGGTYRSALWYAVDPTVTTATVVVDWGAEAVGTAWALHFLGASTPHDYATANGAGGTQPSRTVANVLSGEYTIDNIATESSGDGSSFSVSAPQTELLEAHIGAGTDHGIGASYDASGTGTVTMDWSIGIGDWGQAAFALSVASGGGGETITLDKWLPRWEVRRGVKAVMVPSGMTPPDRND